jgi:hypothetical protein
MVRRGRGVEFATPKSKSHKRNGVAPLSLFNRNLLEPNLPNAFIFPGTFSLSPLTLSNGAVAGPACPGVTIRTPSAASTIQQALIYQGMHVRDVGYKPTSSLQLVLCRGNLWPEDGRGRKRARRSSRSCLIRRACGTEMFHSHTGIRSE